MILRTLKAQGLTTDDVQLVELPSPQFLTALQSKQVDIAPLSEPTVTKYLNQYGPDGATALATDAVDALTVLWAPVEVLQDPAKAAAIKAFIPFWARGEVWAWENQDAWIQKYYVESEQVSAEDGKRIVDSVGQRPVYPANWDAAVEWTQDTVQLLSDAGYLSGFDADELFDRRFETIAADAVPAEYRGGVQPSSARPARASRRCSSCSPGSTTPPTARCGSTVSTPGHWTSRRSGSDSVSFRRSRTCSAPPSATPSPTGARTRPTRRSRPPAERSGPTRWCPGSPSATCSRSGSTGATCRPGNVSCWPSPAPNWWTPTSCCWTRPRHHWTWPRRTASGSQPRTCPGGAPPSSWRTG
ncbi:ABC transporter substrate-binding protein [Rhodococcus opacus RKJ300 = JCM 13270]|uniref:ABC transporter substrate-binding protein n=1 Tax=Rhodococcus opacus RKJ300 = JCM 13270 TaxID=1165867 RepID=I0WAR8_RHOOP|nr:ABC transporter substrate-binding protein [Rhodococcus opacus RKJ300 = JCM 13270]